MFKQHWPMAAGDEGDAGGVATAEAPAAAAPAAPAAAPSAPAPAAAAPAPATAQQKAAPAPAAAKVAPAAAPAAPADKPAETPAADAEPQDKPGVWPPNWRETVSKDDAKVLARLQRYASPEAALQALIAAQNRIAAGELKPVLGKNPTPEQLKEYREAMGIPEEPEKYDLGDVAAGMSKDGLAGFLKLAHETNQTPAQAQASLRAFRELATRAEEMRADNDTKQAQATEDQLRDEWGTEFRRNMNLIHGMLDSTADQNLKSSILDARMPDGTKLGSSPEALRFLAQLALIQNPTGVVVPGSEANPLMGVDEEIGKIEKTMRENRAAYNKDEKMQARYRQLLEAREKLKPRNAG